jgi:hypothetical protein
MLVYNSAEIEFTCSEINVDQIHHARVQNPYLDERRKITGCWKLLEWEVLLECSKPHKRPASTVDPHGLWADHTSWSASSERGTWKLLLGWRNEVETLSKKSKPELNPRRRRILLSSLRNHPNLSSQDPTMEKKTLFFSFLTSSQFQIREFKNSS